MHEILDRYGGLLASLGLLVLTLLAYWSVQGFDFVRYDDGIYVLENDHVRRGLSSDGFRWAFGTTETGNWHPLTWLSLMVDASLYGLNAAGFHWTNLCLHIANTLALLWIFRRMTGEFGKSFFVAACFALHPLHVESVAWVAERKDVLSAFFWMVTLVTYLYYVERPSILRYLCIFITFSLGLLAKPMLVTLPLVMLLLDFWPLGRWSPKRYQTAAIPVRNRRRESPVILILEKLPLLILSGLASVVTYAVQQAEGAIAAADQLSVLSRLANAVVAYAAYIGKMLWPRNLAVFYPHPGLWPPGEVLFSTLVLLAVTVFVLGVIRNHAYLFVGWFWYLGTLVPVIGVVQVGSQAMADRYTYLPLTGLGIMIAWGIPALLAGWRWRRFLLVPGTAVLLSLLAWCTWLQVQHWQNSYTLFSHAAAVTRGNYVAHSNLGRVMLGMGRAGEAAGQFLEAVRIRPNYEPAYDGLGLALAGQGRHAEASKAYESALKIRPDYGEAHYHLGALLAAMGRYGEAEGHYREAMKGLPGRAAIHNHLAVALTHQGRYAKAIQEYRETLRLQPAHAGAWNNLAMVLQSRGRNSEAIGAFEEAIRREPQYAHAHYQLSLLLKNRGRFEESLIHYRQAVEINPAFAEKPRDAAKR
jgi:Flp pilus assembly protein TadD